MNMQEESRNGYVVSEKMKKVWALQLQLVKKLLEVCEKYNLRVWAEGGTLLGTIREKGYIPWDDDIDMAMLRPDYDKFQEVAAKEFPEPYFIQNGYTDYYFNGITKIRIDGTAAILAHQHVNFIRHQGIFIDIFPLDALPDNPAELHQLMVDAKRIIRPLKYYCGGNYSPLHPQVLMRTLKGAYLVKTLGKQRVYKQYEDLFRKYKIEDNAKVSLHAWYYDLKRFSRDKHWYDDTLWMPFEDIMIPVPSGYHGILTMQFGDYMTPVKAPSYHGDFLILDTERPYQEYLPLLKKQHKWDSWKHRRDLLLRLVGMNPHK
ncbi:MAG: LicD family protein [Prevotella sp.]|nr:LicD family protein [Prevotella sp.]